MQNPNIILGDDSANALTGTSGSDLIYGFNPNGPESQVSSITANRVASGFSQPVFVSEPTGDMNHLYVVERTGAIKIVDLDTKTVEATPFLDISNLITTFSEGGLLGLAFDPNFAQNGFFYVYYTDINDNSQVARYQVSSGNPHVADPNSATPIITVQQDINLGGNHKAGWIGFGPDDNLYVALGDGGGAGDPDHNGQNPQSLLAKMLRLDVHGDDFANDPARNYAIPKDNPFVGQAGVAPEIYALGLRNPFRDSFDRGTGTFFIGDVGQARFEEVDIGHSGANYGWNTFEGDATFGGETISVGTLTFPIYTYDHTFGVDIIGGYVYRGTSDGLQGQYFFADQGDDKVVTLRFDGNQWVAIDRTAQVHPDAGTLNSPVSFGEDGSGNLYIVDFDGDIFRLTPDVAATDLGDTISAGAGDDMIFGGAGDDVLDGGQGADVLNGGVGFDYASYASASAAVVANLADPTSNTGDAAGDTYIMIEGLIGSAFADTLVGDSQNNAIKGGGGNDTIDAGAGVDTTVFSGMRSASRLTLLANGAIQVIGPDGTDTLSNVEFLAFDDKLVSAASLRDARDFAGDASADVLLQNGGNGNIVYANMTHGDFSGWVNVATTPGWNVVGEGHVTGNQSSNIVIQNSSTSQIFYANIVGGAFGNWVNVGTTPGWTVRGVGDVNNDGFADVVAQNQSTSQIAYANMTNGSNAGWLDIATTPGFKVAAVADVDGDGFADVIVQNTDTGTIDYAAMANGSFNKWVGVASTPGWSVVGSGDINGDGNADIVIQNQSTSEILYANMSDGNFAGWVEVGSTPGWNVVAVEGVMGNGYDDIVIQNTSSGALDYANMTTGTFQGWASISNAPGYGGKTGPGVAVSDPGMQLGPLTMLDPASSNGTVGPVTMNDPGVQGGAVGAISVFDPGTEDGAVGPIRMYDPGQPGSSISGLGMFDPGPQSPALSELGFGSTLTATSAADTALLLQHV